MRSRVAHTVGSAGLGVNGDAELSALMGDVALHLLGKPNPSSKGGDWRWGKNDKLSVNPQCGVWFDHSTGENGGVLALIKRQTGRTDGRAWLREKGFLDEAGRAKPRTGNKRAKANGGGNGHGDKDAETARKLADARRIAAETVPIRGTLADKYLCSRGISIAAGKLPDQDLRDIRFHPGDPDDPRCRLPMLVALLRHPVTGEVSGAIQRTRINADGTRACRKGKDGRLHPLRKISLGSIFSPPW
jgi:hypothetical protein